MIVLLLLSLVYGIKGIFPFGELSVGYGDFFQVVVPMYYHIYDAFYLHKNLFYDYFSGTGVNMWGTIAHVGLSPISLLILCFDRENIVYAFSFVLMAKMALIATTSYYFFHKMAKRVEEFWKISFSVMYAFSSYVLLFFMNIQWLDNVILFPLLIIALKKLLDRQKVTMYIVVLSFNLFVNFYIAYMCLLFVFFGSGLYLHFFVKKEKQAYSIFWLGIGTLISILLASVIIFPVQNQISMSVRANMIEYADVFSLSQGIPYDKLVFLCIPSMMLLSLFVLMKNYRRIIKSFWFLLCLFAISSVGIIVEPINKLWHAGSYYAFPFRYGFIPIFLLICIRLRYLTKHQNLAQPHQWLHRTYLFIPLFLSLYSLTLVVGHRFFSSLNERPRWIELQSNQIFYVFILCSLFILMYGIVEAVRRDRLRYYLFGAVILTEILIYSLSLIGVRPEYSLKPAWAVDTILHSIEISQEAQFEKNLFHRVRDKENLFSSNYPLVLGQAAISNITHVISKEQQDAFWRLGYTRSFTRISDNGGTIFSDYLLSIHHVFTRENLDERVYSKRTQASNINVYDYKYPPSSLLFVPEDTLNSFLNIEERVFDVQNKLYHLISGDQEDIIEVPSVNGRGEALPSESTITRYGYNASEKINGMKSEIKTYMIHVKGLKNLYVDASRSSSVFEFYVNRDRVDISSQLESRRDIFPNQDSNALLDLGIFEDEKVRLTISSSSKMQSEISFGLLDIEKFQSFALSKNQMKFKSNLTTQQLEIHVKNETPYRFLFLPLSFDKGLRCTVNDQTVQPRTILDNFMVLPVEAGQNHIQFTFYPQGFWVGFIVSILTLVGCIIMLIYHRKRRIRIHFSQTHQRIIIQFHKVIYLFVFITIFCVPILISLF
jgi:uncharacterized membrane protein YfhO